MRRRNLRKNMGCFLSGLMILSAITGGSLLRVDAKEYKITEENIVDLSVYEEKVVIDDRQVIEDIAIAYGLGDPDEIEKIVYAPLEESVLNDNNTSISPKLLGPDYYIKQLGSFNGAGPLLRDSWYVAPGGTMTVTESLSINVEFANHAQVEGGIEQLKAVIGSTYGISFNRTISVSDSQNVEVATGCKKNVKAYVHQETYRYELWEEDIWEDDKIGYGTWIEPIGVLFVVGQNVSL